MLRLNEQMKFQGLSRGGAKDAHIPRRYRSFVMILKIIPSCIIFLSYSIIKLFIILLTDLGVSPTSFHDGLLVLFVLFLALNYKTTTAFWFGTPVQSSDSRSNDEDVRC